MKQDQLTQEYRNKGKMEGSELVLHHEDALSYIDDCEKLGLTIIGMDFYREQGTEIIPLIGNSADYSSIANSPNAKQLSIIAARKLIKDVLPDNAVWVSFVLKE